MPAGHGGDARRRAVPLARVGNARCGGSRPSLLLLDPNPWTARPRSGGSTHSQSSQYSHSGSQAGQQYGQQRDMRGSAGSWDKKSSTGSVGSARDSRDSRGSRGSNDGLRMSGGPGLPLPTLEITQGKFLSQSPTDAASSR